MEFFKKNNQNDDNNEIKENNDKKDYHDKNEFKLSDLFWKGYDVDIIEAKNIVVEVYRETKVEEDCEVPTTFIGIRLYENDTLKENIVLHSFGDYGLFSYISVRRHAASMKLAIDMADFITNHLLSGFEMFDFKIKKRFLSEKHIALLDIASEYEIKMPALSERLQEILDAEVKEHERLREKAMNNELKIQKYK